MNSEDSKKFILCTSEGSLCSCSGSIPPLDDATPSDEDVLAEETSVKQQAATNEVDPNVAVQIRGLTKTYPGTTKIGCCKCQRSSPYHAVKVFPLFTISLVSLCQNL